MDKNKSNPYSIILILLIIGSTILGTVSLLRDRIVNPERNQISIRSQGKIYAKPDIAQVKFGVKTATKPEAAQAANEGAKKMNQVIAGLKSLGIKESDIQTTTFDLRPVYSYPEGSGKRVLDGYELYQEVSTKIRNLDKIGEAIKLAAQEGANQLGNINFTIDDPDELKEQARTKAIAKAKAKAEKIAQDTGIKLGKLVNVIENDYYVPSPTPLYKSYGAEYAMDASVAPNVEAGEMEIKMEVTLVYKVK